VSKNKKVSQRSSVRGRDGRARNTEVHGLMVSSEGKKKKTGGAEGAAKVSGWEHRLGEPGAGCEGRVLQLGTKRARKRQPNPDICRTQKSQGPSLGIK